MKVAIIEDENLAVQRLKAQLNKIRPDIQAERTAASIREAVQMFAEEQFDLVFCDIHLSDGLSFGIFEQVEVKCPVIFTTAYDQYAIQAFKVNSVDYLLKPFSTDDLRNAIEKYEQMFGSENLDVQSILEAYHKKEHQWQKRFIVYIGDKIRTVDSEEVAYFYAEGKYVFLFTTNGKEYIVDFTLDRLSEILDPEKFYRINRQFIVSLNGVNMMHIYPKGRVKIDLNPPSAKDAIVSIERSSGFKKWLNS